MLFIRNLFIKIEEEYRREGEGLHIKTMGRKFFAHIQHLRSVLRPMMSANDTKQFLLSLNSGEEFKAWMEANTKILNTYLLQVFIFSHAWKTTKIKIN